MPSRWLNRTGPTEAAREQPRTRPINGLSTRCLSANGITELMTTKADDLLRDSVRSGEVSGVVAMATASGSPPYVCAFGARATVISSRMSPDTIFKAPGLARPIMAVAGLQLVDSGVLGLDEPLRTIIPALSQPLVLTGFDRS